MQVRPTGSRSMLQGPALSEEELWRALGVGAEAVRRAVAGGCDGGDGGAAAELPGDWRQCVVLLGEVGIGNTTAAAALLAALTGAALEEVVGRGTGGCWPGPAKWGRLSTVRDRLVGLSARNANVLSGV